jgi:hypothetical protein
MPWFHSVEFPLWRWSRLIPFVHQGHFTSSKERLFTLRWRVNHHEITMKMESDSIVLTWLEIKLLFSHSLVRYCSCVKVGVPLGQGKGGDEESATCIILSSD